MDRLSYEIFKAEWEAALRRSKLQPRPFAEETLDLGSMSRRYSAYVEALDRQGAEPFYAVARTRWSWDPLLSARTRTTEEDLLSEVLGPGDMDTDTEQPWLRVDLRLSAMLTMGTSLPMPPQAKWSTWVHELMHRLERLEPLVGPETVREDDDGGLAILAWQGGPEVLSICDPTGQVRLMGVTIDAWQSIQLPRNWDDPDREPDEPLAPQLDALFVRLRAALQAWVEVMDHLK